MSDNQRSEKNIIMFRDIVRRTGLFPHRLMVDAGVENFGINAVQTAASDTGIPSFPLEVEVSQWHLSQPCVDFVSSFRNIRVEHPWVWVNQVSNPYLNFFHWLVKEKFIESNNEFHIAMLHIAFYSEIERKIQVYNFYIYVSKFIFI